MEPGKSKKGGDTGKHTTNVYIRSDADYVKSARKFAKENDISLSALVENYFRIIHEKVRYPKLDMPVSQSLKGILKGMGRTRSDYLTYLIEKYK